MGRDERGDLRVLPGARFCLLKKGDILGVRPWPAALDVLDPEGVEALGPPELVVDGKIDALPLAAIAQGGVVDFNFGCHIGRINAGKM